MVQPITIAPSIGCQQSEMGNSGFRRSAAFSLRSERGPKGRSVMASRLSTESLARSSARRPWVIIGIWVLVLVVFVGLAATLLGDALTTEFKLTNDADSVLADKLIENRLSGPAKTNEIAIVSSESLTVDDEAFQQQVERIFGILLGLGDDVVEGGCIIT